MSEIWEELKDFDQNERLSARVLKDGKSIKSIMLESAITYIGRMNENHIVVDDPKASRSHALIKHESGRYFLEDQESENGTFVNDKRVKSTELFEGDVIRIGATKIAITSTQSGVYAHREDQMNEQDQEWRNNQTVNVIDPLMQKKLIEELRQKKERESKDNKENKKPNYPSLDFKMKWGSKVIEKTIHFEKAQLRDENQENFIHIQIAYGKYVVTKKLPIE